ncbi:MAG: helix-turn-helix transcriptional regulator [Eubacteriales bacterium]|nr:helix-turn-helix transcriptional regulator [Eubacteriales bacterium]
MFDNMKIAKRIREARIAKNLTQMNLADAMGVSYQAVSNWERGNSLPDISKLEDLCRALDLTVGSLLGTEAPAVEKVLEAEPLSMEELAEAAPMLPPAEVKAQVEQERKRKKIDLSAIAAIAPFLDEAYLDSLLQEAELSSLDCLDEVAPFLSRKTLAALVERADPSQLALFDDVLCFLGHDAVDRLILRCFASGNTDFIEEAAPFASKNGLDALVDACIAANNTECLEDIYCFLAKGSVKKLAQHLMEKKDIEALSEIGPYL